MGKMVPAASKQEKMGSRAEAATKAAEEATKKAASQEDRRKRDVTSLHGGGVNTNKAPMKSALRKKTKETVKEFKNELIVTVRLSVTYERKKKQIRKKV